MIIVSQDKDLIVNFDNTTVIGIAQNNSKEIDSITVNGEEQFLAEYETEERAKEVLKEITRMYQETRIVYRGQANYNPVNSIDRPIYEMPKE